MLGKTVTPVRNYQVGRKKVNLLIKTRHLILHILSSEINQISNESLADKDTEIQLYQNRVSDTGLIT